MTNKLKVYLIVVIKGVKKILTNSVILYKESKYHDLTKDPIYMNYYSQEVEEITGVLYGIWRINPHTEYIADWAYETKHLGLMRFVLAKYSEELREIVISQNDGIQYSQHDVLSNRIKELENNSQEYETLRDFYDSILKDNNIDLDELTNIYLVNSKKK